MGTGLFVCLCLSVFVCLSVALSLLSGLALCVCVCGSISSWWTDYLCVCLCLWLCLFLVNWLFVCVCGCLFLVDWLFGSLCVLSVSLSLLGGLAVRFRWTWYYVTKSCCWVLMLRVLAFRSSLKQGWGWRWYCYVNVFFLVVCASFLLLLLLLFPITVFGHISCLLVFLNLFGEFHLSYLLMSAVCYDAHFLRKMLLSKVCWVHDDMNSCCSVLLLRCVLLSDVMKAALCVPCQQTSSSSAQGSDSRVGDQVEEVRQIMEERNQLQERLTKSNQENLNLTNRIRVGSSSVSAHCAPT